MRSEDFKQAVGKYPTGVCVVSTNHDGKFWGLTVNSLASVSLAPPFISFCLAHTSFSMNAFSGAEHFAVNILSAEQVDLAQHFASKEREKFMSVKHEIYHIHGLPILSNSCSVLLCKKVQQISCGDHDIFIGEVLETVIDEEKKPMIYFSRSFTKLL